MKIIVTSAAKIFLILLLLSCVNTSYSRFDEVAIDDELVDIILGQFPHHGEAFYEHEIKIKEPILKENAQDFELRNDVAVAYLKLARWEDAKFHFDLNEKYHPGKYKTHANLGVMHKKMGEYKRAAYHIKKSLEIKPEGHMGLGDYYLKMIKWKEEYDSENKLNFLGIAYDNIEETAKAANREYVITLIKNDFRFVDVYIVLGDILFTEKEYQLAMRAYIRAEVLASRQELMTQYRIANSKFYMAASKEAEKKSFFQVSHINRGKAQIKSEIKQAQRWLKRFQSMEALMINEGQSITFEKVRSELQKGGIYKQQVVEAVVFKGLAIEPISTGFFIIVFLLVCYYIYDKRKRMKLEREGQKPLKYKMNSFKLYR